MVEGSAEVLHVQVSLLARMNGKLGSLGAVAILDLAATTTALGEICVAQNGKEPRTQVGALLEAVQVVPCLEQRLLHQIVGALDVAAQRHGESAQVWDQAQQRLFERDGLGIHPRFSLASSSSSNLTKRSGTGWLAVSEYIDLSCRPS